MAAETKSQAQQQSRLLQLPVELQLTIFEYAVIENEPLLLNCGCDSSYDGDFDALDEDRALWTTGEKHSPLQPALTLTCKIIRAVTLPMFYLQNAFRAHYCYETDFDMVIKWLRLIGPANRRLLRDFCLWDMNPRFDQWRPDNLRKASRSEAFRGMGGSMETLKRDDCCCHRVTFGDEDHDYYGLVPQLFESIGVANVPHIL